MGRPRWTDSSIFEESTVRTTFVIKRLFVIKFNPYPILLLQKAVLLQKWLRLLNNVNGKNSMPV